MSTQRHLRQIITRPRRILAGITALALATIAWQLPVSNAEFTAITNTDNAVEALTIAPPTNITATMAANILPLLTCRVTLTWTASTTPDITGYEIIRVVASTGTTAAGPWTTTNLTIVDNPVPLQLIGSAYEWRVRTLHSTWHSTWQPATPNNLLACLL